MNFQIGDFVSIYEDVIDKRILVLMRENKPKQIQKWELYRNAVFEIVGFDVNANLVIIAAPDGNRIYVSRRAIYLITI